MGEIFGELGLVDRQGLEDGPEPRCLGRDWSTHPAPRCNHSPLHTANEAGQRLSRFDRRHKAGTATPPELAALCPIGSRGPRVPTIRYTFFGHFVVGKSGLI